MKLFKGKKSYPIKKGDYLLDNGACCMFKPKDNSILPMGEWYRSNHLIISRKEFNRLIKTEHFCLVERDSIKYYLYKGEENAL